MLTWIRPDILKENQSWVGEWTAREAVITALRRLGHAAGGLWELGPVTDAAGNLERRLRALWPEYGEVIPHWPALSGPGGGSDATLPPRPYPLSPEDVADAGYDRRCRE
jgi:hypothetical protein